MADQLEYKTVEMSALYNQKHETDQLFVCFLFNKGREQSEF